MYLQNGTTSYFEKEKKHAYSNMIQNYVHHI